MCGTVLAAFTGFVSLIIITVARISLPASLLRAFVRALLLLLLLPLLLLSFLLLSYPLLLPPCALCLCLASLPSALHP
jgi:hypothetical protein